MEEKLVKSILLATANAFAPPEKLGRPRTDHGLLIDTFIRVLRTGMPWRDVRDVDFRTAHRHFILWARGGIFEKTYRRLLALCSRRNLLALCSCRRRTGAAASIGVLAGKCL